MSQKFAIPINISTEELCVFLNDGHPINYYPDKLVLMVEINGPREITTKIHARDEVFNGDSWTLQDPNVTILVAE